MGFSIGQRKGGGQAARELRKQANHGSLFMTWGRVWATILLVSFSLGAVVTLAGVPLQHIATALEHGQAPDVTEAITTVTILALVIGMDLAMIIATMMIRGMRARGKKFEEWWPYLAIALFVGVSEATTFAVMTVNNEHPNSGVAWALVGVRAVGVPITAVFLSLVSNLPITPNDVRAKLQIEAGQGLMAYLEEAVQTGKADPSALFAFFGLVNDTSAMEQSGWEVRVQEALARLSPDAVRSELERRVMEAERLASEAVTQAKDDAIEWTSRALTSLLATGNLPQWLIDARPELADITLTKSAISRGKRAPTSQPKTPASRAEALRLFLANLELMPAKAPDKKRGVWVKSTDIPALSGDLILKEDATKLAQRLGKDATKTETAPRDGLAYIAPLEAVMQELIERHKVSEAVANAWVSLPQGADNAEPIPLQTWRQA